METLRDYFAGKALEGELACQGRESTGVVDRLDILARRCWSIADAMLKERDAGPKAVRVELKQEALDALRECQAELERVWSANLHAERAKQVLEELGRGS